MTVIEWVKFIALILAIVLVIVDSMVVLIKSKAGNLTRKQIAGFVSSLGILFIVYLAVNIWEITPTDGLQLMLTGGLVAVTGVYALFTAKQVEASVKMAEEMREQTIISSRPMIFQRAVEEKNIYEGSSSEKFSHFEIYNAGNGTAVEVQVCLLDQWEKARNGQRQGFLRVNEPPMEFHTDLPTNEQSPTFYVVSEYQDIYCNVYQTWMPCKLSVNGKVIPGKLEFRDNVPESKRIGLFNTEFDNRSKPK